MHRPLIILTAISGFLFVALGAFGAHGLKASLSDYSYQIYQTGIFYQGIHTLAMAFCSLLALFHQQQSQTSLTQQLQWVAICFFAGILLFSGSLYLLAINGIKAFGIITPIGGTLWLGAWGYLGYVYWKHH